jgi:hypothetical protein
MYVLQLNGCKGRDPPSTTDCKNIIQTRGDGRLKCEVNYHLGNLEARAAMANRLNPNDHLRHNHESQSSNHLQHNQGREKIVHTAHETPGQTQTVRCPRCTEIGVSTNPTVKVSINAERRNAVKEGMQMSSGCLPDGFRARNGRGRQTELHCIIDYRKWSCHRGAGLEAQAASARCTP